MYDVFCTRIGVYHYSLFDFKYTLNYTIKFNLHLHDIYFVNVCDLYIPVIMVNTLRFKSSVLYGTNTLLDKPLTILKLPTHLSKLPENG